MCTAILERSPELLTSAALYIEVGSTRAVELGALLVGNLAFNEASAGALVEMNIAVHRLVSLMIEGGDRARELCTLALANLTCINKFVDQFLAEEGAMEVILGVQESGATGRAREAACRIVANCSMYRLQSNGVKMPQGKGKVLSEHTCVSASSVHVPSHSHPCPIAGSVSLDSSPSHCARLGMNAAER